MDATHAFREAYRNRHTAAEAWRSKGGKVFGCIYAGVPEELIYAAGVLPVQVLESESEQAVARGETILPIFVCDYCQSCLGQILEAEYGYLDGVVVSDACANLRTLMRAWKMHADTPFYYYLSPPFAANREGREYYVQEMNRFRNAIQDRAGTEITDEALSGAIEVYNENRRLMRKVYARRAEGDAALSGGRVLEIVRAGFVMPKEEHNQALQTLLETSPRPRDDRDESVPVFVSMVTFEHCATEDWNLMDMIEEAGGRVVGDDLIMGARCFSNLVEPRPDPMEALVDRYLGKVPLGYRYPLAPRVAWLLAEMDRSGARGAVFVVPKYCHPYLFEYPYVERALRDKAIPVLFLESEGGMPREAVKVRLDAFMERGTLVEK